MLHGRRFKRETWKLVSSQKDFVAHSRLGVGLRYRCHELYIILSTSGGNILFVLTSQPSGVGFVRLNSCFQDLKERNAAFKGRFTLTTMLNTQIDVLPYTVT